jgi:hypothetical protein
MCRFRGHFHSKYRCSICAGLEVVGEGLEYLGEELEYLGEGV